MFVGDNLTVSLFENFVLCLVSNSIIIKIFQIE